MEYDDQYPLQTQHLQQGEMADPKSMSLEVIFSMFQSLQRDISEIKSDRLGDRITKLERTERGNAQEVRAIKFEQLQQQDKIDKLTQDMDYFKTRTEVLSGMVQRMQLQINEHADKHERNDMEKARCSVMIRNLYSGENEMGHQTSSLLAF